MDSKFKNKTIMKTTQTKPQYFKHVVKCLLINLAWMSISCAPPFSEMQSARLVGKNNFEITPGFSSVSFSNAGESKGLQNHLGMQLAYGISENVDLRLRFEHIWLKDNSYSTQVIGLGPKISLKKDRMALYAPIGLALGNKDSWEFHPTMLFTLPLSPKKVDFNPSFKYLVMLCKDCQNAMAVNAGFAFSSDLTKWAIRPEYGLLFNPNKGGHYGHFSIGVSLNVSNLSKK